MTRARMFTERHCGAMLSTLYSPEMYDFAGYRKQISIFYTHGKDHNWQDYGGEGSTAAGVIAGAYLIPEQKIAAGAALIDLKATRPIPRLSSVVSFGGVPKLEASPPTLRDYRYSTLAVLAHEMFHFIQHWRAGDTLEGDRIDSPSLERYSRTFHAIREAVRRQHPDWSDQLISSAAHAKHPDEQAAERFAQARLAKYRRQIERGDWDACLPVEDMRSYIAHWQAP